MQRRVSQAFSSKAASGRKNSREVLAEGIVPLRKNGQRDWQAIGDEELVAYAKKVIEKKRIKNRKGLKKEDPGLYRTLGGRKLLDKIGLDKKTRDWASMNDKELVEHTQKFVKEKGIRSRKGLAKEDSGLYKALRKRKLLDKVEFGEKRRKRRDWASMNDEELVAYAKKVVENEGIKNRKGLAKEDSGLYEILRIRKLLDKIGFEEKRERREIRDWASLSDDELVAYAKNFLKEKEVRNKRGLQKEDIGLYDVLRKRKLLDRVGFEMNQEKRDWASMNDDELLTLTKMILDMMKISRRSELEKADKRLYLILWRRKLLDDVGFEIKRKYRDWASMNDEELVEYAKKFVEEKGIRSRSGLEKEDSGLWHVLWRRKLLDQVFADIEKLREREAVQQVYDAMMEFGGQA